MKLWQILGAVALGVVADAIAPGRFSYALGHATLYVFLPPLLFEASWNLRFAALRRTWRAAAVLAGPGVVWTTLVVAGALVPLRVPYGVAFLTGAILSATDPIAVVAVLRRIRVPIALATIVECEALFNDAVAVVLYRIALGAIAVGAVGAGAMFGIVASGVAGAVGGVALGVAIGYAAAQLMRRLRGNLAQIAVTIAVAYGAYFAADAIAFSGIFATIGAGIAVRYFDRRWLAPAVASDVDRAWTLGAAAANACVFFLVGAALPLSANLRQPAFAVATLIAVAAARLAVVEFLRPGGFPPAWFGLVRAAGMRGALSLALALALPPMAYRQTIVDATFAVVLVSLVLSVLTVPAQARRAQGARSRTTRTYA